MNFKKVVPVFDEARSVSDWKVGQVVVGKFEGVVAERMTTTKAGKSYQSRIYGFDVKGEKVKIWSCGSLDAGLKTCLPGWIIRITYLGRKKFKNGEGANFDVEYDDGPVPPAEMEKLMEKHMSEVKKPADDDFDINWDE